MLLHGFSRDTVRSYMVHNGILACSYIKTDGIIYLTYYYFIATEVLWLYLRLLPAYLHTYVVTTYH